MLFHLSGDIPRDLADNFFQGEWRKPDIYHLNLALPQCAIQLRSFGNHLWKTEIMQLEGGHDVPMVKMMEMPLHKIVIQKCEVMPYMLICKANFFPNGKFFLAISKVLLIKYLRMKSLELW